MNIRNGQVPVNKLRHFANGRIPFVTIAVMALLFPAGPAAASSKTIPVLVTFGIASVAIVVMLGASALLAPRQPSLVKVVPMK